MQLENNENNVVNKKIMISILYEIYGNMLTERQKTCIDDYYNNDLSLSEIAENNNITRQAVRDNLKLGEKKLIELEEKLKFYEKIKKFSNELENLKDKYKETEIEKDINKIKDIISYYI